MSPLLTFEYTQDIYRYDFGACRVEEAALYQGGAQVEPLYIEVIHQTQYWQHLSKASGRSFWNRWNMGLSAVSACDSPLSSGSLLLQFVLSSDSTVMTDDFIVLFVGSARTSRTQGQETFQFCVTSVV